MYKTRKMLLWMASIGCFLLVPVFSNAQEKLEVTGLVLDAAEMEPVPGATIQNEEGIVLAIAGENGSFKVDLPMNTPIIVSMVGYKTQTFIVSGQQITIELETGTSSLEEVVVVGYGTQKRELLTGSVSTIKFDEISRNLPTVSLGNVLAGQMPGVRVATPRGIPGSDPGISIRQGSSWNAQNVLYIIDGKISGSGDFNNLSPNDIDNITVLKDAASTAVYGSRAAAGVVVVTTRKGVKSSKPVIDYAFSTGFDKRTKNAPLTSAVETAIMYNRIGDPIGWKWEDSDIDYFRNINNGWGYDQLETMWTDPSTTTHNLSVSGGSENLAYYIGGSYTNAQSFFDNLGEKNYNLRSNITADITDRISLFAGLSLNSHLLDYPSADNWDDVYGKLRIWQPDQPVWTTNGHPIDYGWIQNMGAQVSGDNGYRKVKLLKPVINLKATYKIPGVEGLSTSAQYNTSFANTREKTWVKQYPMWIMKKSSTHIISTDPQDLVSLKQSFHTNRLSESNSWGSDYQLNLQLNYENSFNNVHHVKGWLIYERFESTTGSFSGTREQFPVYITDQWWATSSDREDSYVGGSTEQPTGRKSWIGQFFYDYKSKYLLSLAYRYDGSMNFAPDKRWGFFPSGSLGWVLSNEPFLSSAKGVDLLKLRASVGLTGNDAVGGWQWQETYDGGNSAFLGETPSTNVGIRYGSLVNPDLTWEKTLSYNVGVDAEFLDHFSATAEYYSVKTYDILGSRIQSVSPTFSRSLPASNYGEINARGVELSLGYRGKSQNLSFYANAMASYGVAKYKIRDQNITYPWQDQVGESTTRIVTRVVDGMLRTQEELDAFTAAHPDYKYYGYMPELGQLVYRDLNGPDGVPDGVIDDWDLQEVRKNNDPVVVGLNFGVSWKGFSIDATFNGYLKYRQYVTSLAGNVEWNRNWIKWYSDSWLPDNPNAALPKRYSVNDGTFRVNRDQSTFWLKKSNFLRLKFLNVSYSLPQTLVSKVNLSNVRLYFTGTNLFVISKFNKLYYDPEIGGHTNFPVMKTFNFGVNLTL